MCQFSSLFFFGPKKRKLLGACVHFYGLRFGISFENTLSFLFFPLLHLSNVEKFLCVLFELSLRKSGAESDINDDCSCIHFCFNEYEINMCGDCINWSAEKMMHERLAGWMKKLNQHARISRKKAT
jgi:hypothetical protein